MEISEKTDTLEEKSLSEGAGELKIAAVRRRRNRLGQGLIEVLLALPVVLVLTLAIIEFGRAWQLHHIVRLAVLDGLHTATSRQDGAVGAAQIAARLQAAGIRRGSISVAPSVDGYSFEANVSVDFVPLLGGVSLPMVGGPVTLIPSSFPIEYQEVRQVRVY